MIHPLKSGLLIVFLFSVMTYLWSCLRIFCGNTQVTYYLTWKMEYVLSIFVLINGLFSTCLSVILLWMFSVVFIYNTSELENQQGKGKKLTITRGKRASSKVKKVTAADSIRNAEKFLHLFQVWLYEEQNVTTEVEPLEEKIYKLQSACKQLTRIQIIIDSLKTQSLYSSGRDTSKSLKIHNLLDKFDYIKTYMELRMNMLTIAEKQFSALMEEGKELKVWLSEALEFQEGLHHVTCDSHHVVQQQLLRTQVMRKISKQLAGKLETYKSAAQKLTATLQEMGSFSDRFQTALRKDIGSKQKRWSDTLMRSVTEEVTQVGERFSTFLKLNSCYQTHLQGLLGDLRQIKA